MAKKKTRSGRTKQVDRELEAEEVVSRETPVDLSQSSGIQKPKAEEKVEPDIELSSEIDTNLKVAVEAKKKWEGIAKEDVKFALGDQWNEEEKQILREQFRPCMTFNKIKPMIQLVTGHMIQNMARIEIFPEGGEDQNFTEVMDRAIDHIEKITHLNFELSYLFSIGERSGWSWFEFFVDYDEDPIFGHLCVNQLGPFRVYPDPSWTKYDLSDAGFLFKVGKLSKGRLKQLYPKKEQQIQEIAEDSLAAIMNDVRYVEGAEESDYGNDPHAEQGLAVESSEKYQLTGDLMQLTTVEYWKRVYVDRWFVYFVDDGSIEEFENEDDAKKEIERRRTAAHALAVQEWNAAIQQGPAPQTIGQAVQLSQTAPVIEEIQVEHVMRKRRVRRMKVAVRAGDVVLTDGLQDSPFEPFYHDFPIFMFISEWSPEAERLDLRIQGLVRSLKDPQRELNKARSQFLHILNTSANSGWIGDQDALTDEEWNNLKNFGSTPGITIRKKTGSYLERITPVPPSLAQQVREKAAENDFKEVSGINADLLSIDGKGDPSGKAIRLRIRQAITILQPSFQNFRYTKYNIGTFLFKIVPSLFDARKLQKVCGEKFMQERQLNINQLKAYLTMIKDGKFNTQISEAGNPDTVMQETFEDLMALVEAGMPLPPDLLFEFMPLKNKQDVINRVQKYQAQQALLSGKVNQQSEETA